MHMRIGICFDISHCRVEPVLQLLQAEFTLTRCGFSLSLGSLAQVRHGAVDVLLRGTHSLLKPRFVAGLFGSLSGLVYCYTTRFADNIHLLELRRPFMG